MKHIRNIGALIAALVSTLPHAALAVTAVQNPLNTNYSTVPTFIAGFLKVMVQIGIPIVALFILIAGFKFVSATGNQEKLKNARENLVYVVIGSLLILGAWVLATLIGGTVSQITGP